MKPENYSTSWRDWIGIGVCVIAALALAFVLWQVSRLTRESGIDARTVDRERLAVATTEKLVPLQAAISEYRDALVREVGAQRIAQRRDAVDRLIGPLDREFRSGDAAALLAQNKWLDLRSSWRTSRKAHPGFEGYGPTTETTRAVQTLIGTLQDNSNLTYEPSSAAQNLAVVQMNETPIGFDLTARAQTLAKFAIEHHGMTLRQRFALSNDVSSLRARYDLSSDYLPQIVAELKGLVPERARAYGSLPETAVDLNYLGTRLRDLLSNKVLLLQSPATNETELQTAAAPVFAKMQTIHELTTSALDESLRARGEIYARRQFLVFLAYLLGALLVVGIIMLVAQSVARRDRLLLREARRESERLTAELARQQAEEALRLSEAQFRAVFDGAAVGIAVTDRTGRFVDANSVFRTMFGESLAPALEGHEADFADLLAGNRETFEYEHHSRTPAGGEVWTDATISIVSGTEGEPNLAMCMFRDKTELKASERRMQHDKMHDALTGLPNRHLFEQQLHRRFEEASALFDSFFAVMCIDLEHFKDVNESMGHAAGDLVLTQIAQRVRSSVDSRDAVARLGSDEFAILIQSLGDILHVESVARRVLNNISKVIPVGSRSIYLGASVGIAIGSASYERAEDVMRDAEIAMQHAKGTGGARYALFDSKMHSRAQKRLQLTSDLRRALERKEFRLLYQPIVDIATGVPAGCEALLRWEHPTEGTLNPSDFVPLAEQMGFAVPLGRFVLQTAAEQMAYWRRNRGNSDFDMHVNVSAAELLDPDFERFLLQYVEQNGLSPGDFTLEITESVVLDAGTRAHLTLERLRSNHFKICIDDFGTGYSSMRYLQQFNVDAIKIDRSFVSGADGELASEPIVRTLMTLAEAFDVRVVAEGVETTRQRDVLRNVGCRYTQGYLYAHPLTAEEMLARYPEVLARVARSAAG